MARAHDSAHADPGLRHDELARNPARRRERTRCEACLAFGCAILSHSGGLRLQLKSLTVRGQDPATWDPGLPRGGWGGAVARAAASGALRGRQGKWTDGRREGGA